MIPARKPETNSRPITAQLDRAVSVVVDSLPELSVAVDDAISVFGVMVPSPYAILSKGQGGFTLFCVFFTKRPSSAQLGRSLSAGIHP